MSNYVSISALADMGFKGDSYPRRGLLPERSQDIRGFPHKLSR